MDWLVFCLSILTGIVALLLIYCMVLTIRIDREKRERQIDINMVKASITSLKVNKKYGKNKTTKKKVVKKKATKKSNVKGVY